MKTGKLEELARELAGRDGARIDQRKKAQDLAGSLREEIVDGARSAGMGAPIRSGDTVVLMTSTGHFVSAERGGGGELGADRASAGGWESFTLILEDGEIP